MHGHADGGVASPVNLSEQVVASALRYRAQAPLIDQLMSEVGLSGGSAQGLLNPAKAQAGTSAKAE